MKAIFQVLFLISLSFSVLMAQEKGEVHIYIFKPDSSAFEGVKVQSGKASTMTDSSGFAMLNLPEGKQVVKFLIKDKVITEMNMNVIPLEITEAILTLGEQKRKLQMDIISDEEEKKKVAAEDLEVGDKSGFMSGNVIDSKSGKPVVNARVFVRGVNAEANTDENGQFKIELPVGTYAISIIQSEYTSTTLENLVVVEEKTTQVTAELLPSAVELEGVSVVAVKITGGVASLVEERRDSKKLVEIIGAEQMAKSGDSNAAAALKRVTGITVVDGKFVYVRGMGERYSQTLLNGMTLPSPIVDKRVVPLDLFPSSIIDSLVVQKTSSADNPGEYGGGIVKVRTKKFPEERVLSVSASTTVNTESTGKTGLIDTYSSSKDWIGIDDGSRDTLNGAKGDPLFLGNYSDEQISAFGRNLSRNWTPVDTKIYPAGSLSLTYGDKIGKDGTSGFFSNFGYSNQTNLRDLENKRFTFEGSTIENVAFNDERTTNTVNLNGLLGFGTTIKEDHDLSATLMMVRTTDRIATKRDYDGPPRVISITPISESYFLQYNEQQLLNAQFGGEHRFMDDKLTFNWDYAISNVKSNRPGDREYNINMSQDGSRVNFIDNITQADGLRIDVRDVEEEIENLAFDLSYDVEIFGAATTFTTGYASTDSDKEFNNRVFRLRNTELDNVFPIEGILFHEDTEFTTPDDTRIVNGSSGNVFGLNEELDGTLASYKASREIDSYFLMSDIEFGDGWVTNFGVRIEEVSTSFESRNANENVDETNVLPSFNLTYKGIENHQFRAGYGQSVNRPAFNELSPEGVILVQGDPYTEGSETLFTAEIQNYDLKWEYYLGETDSFSLGLFYKSIDTPIELFTAPANDGDFLFSYANAESAEIQGIEIDFRRSLLFLKEAWKDFFFATNFTYADGTSKGYQDGSTVLDPDQFDTSPERDFVGLAPIVYNVSLGYDNPETGRNFNILYNYVDKRIYSSTRQGIPEFFLEEFHQLDLVYGQNINEKLKGKFRVRNLLDDENEITQDGQKFQTYKKGISFIMSLSASM